MDSNFENALIGFINYAQKVIDDYRTEHYPSLDRKIVEIVPGGRKYIKLAWGGSVYAFINTKNGDVLKPASWQAPAKHARGNIYDDDNGASAVGVGGYINYLK